MLLDLGSGYEVRGVCYDVQISCCLRLATSVVCVCVCVGVCVCVPVRVCVYALRTASTDKISRFVNRQTITLLLHIRATQQQRCTQHADN